MFETKISTVFGANQLQETIKRKSAFLRYLYSLSGVMIKYSKRFLSRGVGDALKSSINNSGVQTTFRAFFEFLNNCFLRLKRSFYYL